MHRILKAGLARASEHGSRRLKPRDRFRRQVPDLTSQGNKEKAPQYM